MCYMCVLQANHGPVSITSPTSYVKPDYPVTLTKELVALGWFEGYYRGVYSILSCITPIFLTMYHSGLFPMHFQCFKTQVPLPIDEQ